MKSSTSRWFLGALPRLPAEAVSWLADWSGRLYWLRSGNDHRCREEPA